MKLIDCPRSIGFWSTESVATNVGNTWTSTEASTSVQGVGDRHPGRVDVRSRLPMAYILTTAVPLSPNAQSKVSGPRPPVVEEVKLTSKGLSPADARVGRTTARRDGVNWDNGQGHGPDRVGHGERREGICRPPWTHGSERRPWHWSRLRTSNRRCDGPVPPEEVPTKRTENGTSPTVFAVLAWAASPPTTVTTTVEFASCPTRSVTVTFASNVPAETYWWLTLSPEPLGVPSPNDHVAENGDSVPVGRAEKFTTKGVSPEGTPGDVTTPTPSGSAMETFTWRRSSAPTHPSP